MLEVGLKNTLSETVTAEKCADQVGSGTLQVYATPAMTALMEKTAMLCAAPHIEEGKCTVGTALNIKHVRPSLIGARVTCECELTELDRRRMVFTLKVTENGNIIGEGTHERFIVASDKFMEKAREGSAS